MSTTRPETETNLDSELSWLSSESSSTTKPETHELKEDGSALNKFSLEIDKLEHAMSTFPYKELRSIEVTTMQGTFTHASPKAIQQLLAMFSDTFFYSGKESNAFYFKQSRKWLNTPEERKAVFQLANILLDFRQQIEKIEIAYFTTSISNLGIDPLQLAKLRNNSGWVTYFHYVIENYLDDVLAPESNKPFSKQDYSKSVLNIQKLCEATYEWIATNVPEALEKYSTFKPSQKNRDLELIAASATGQSREFLPKPDFLAFFDKSPPSSNSKRKKPLADEKKAGTLTLFKKKPTYLSRKKHTQESVAMKTPSTPQKFSNDIDSASTKEGSSKKRIRQGLAFV